MEVRTCKTSVAILRRLLLRAKHAKGVHSQGAFTTCDTSVKNPKFVNPVANLAPWKSRNEFVSYLAESIFFHHDGLIALNKPYGVAVHKPTKNATNRLTRSKIPETNFTLEDALPALTEQLHLNYLQIMKSTERFTSGICILATNENSANRFKAAARRTNQCHTPFQSYWAVTKDAVVPPMASEIVGYKLVTLEEKDIEPEVIWKPSRKQSKLKKLKLVNVDHRLLSTNEELGVSFCQVDTTTNKSHFVRVYLIQRACCVLGDTLYSARLRSVLGRTIVLSPQNYSKDVDPLPVLEYQVKKSLGLTCSPGEEMAHLPVMLHLRSFTLAKWSKNKDLVLTAPLPEYLRWVCKQLQLDTVPGHQENVPLLLRS